MRDDQTDRMKDAELIARSLEDGRWFEAVFDRHYRAIHRFCTARAGVDAADDLASETFTTAFRRRGSYDAARLDAAPWLYGIAVNQLAATRRREATHRRLTWRVAVDAERFTDGPEKTTELSGDLSAALEGLDDTERDLIVLFAWAELTYAELAEVFAVPVGTIRSRLSRIRRRLRAALEARQAAVREGVSR